MMSMMSVFFSGIIKNIVSAAVAGSMVFSSFMPGPMGEYEKLSSKAMATSPAVTEISIGLDLDVKAIEKLAGEDFGLDAVPEIPGVYKDGKVDCEVKIYAFTDIEDFRFALSLTENLDDGFAVYVDEEGFAIAPQLLDAGFGILSTFEPSFAKEYAVYKKYFGDNGMYITWEQFFGIGQLDVDQEDKAVFELVGTLVSDVCEIVVREDNLKLLADAYAPVFEIASKYYTEETVDGVKKYGSKITGNELMKYCSEVVKAVYSEEMANALVNYVIALADDIDYVKYITVINQFEPEAQLPANLTNEQIAEILKMGIEGYRPQLVEMFKSLNTEFAGYYDALATGNIGEEIAEDEAVKLIYPFLENSYVETHIYEKDGTVTEQLALVVADKNAVYGSLEIATATSEYGKEIPAAKNVVPFDKIVELVEIANKLGYEAAISKGVNSIEISWDSAMYPDEDKVYIYSPYFFVNYNTTMIDALKKDPAFEALGEEEKNAILGMYTEEDYDSSMRDSTAELIDNSIYLPLRQLMENAGYEVSWDGEARKAYVTVDGVKIEMTGVIVNDRTYVKVRDFEKLGATVDYSEEFYRQDAYNDFHKSCTAIITFKK